MQDQVASAPDIGESPLISAMPTATPTETIVASDADPLELSQTFTPPAGPGKRATNNTPPPSFEFNESALMDEEDEGETGGDASGLGQDPGADPVLPATPTVNATTNRQLSNFILETVGYLVPDVAYQYAKLDEEVVAQAETQGELAVGTLDEIRELNARNRRTLEISKADKDYLRGPLEATLQSSEINAPPHVQLMIALAVIMGRMLLQARQIRKENERILANLYELNSRHKQVNVDQQKPE
ncbi:hypothetical protein SAMN05421823_11940 [Catalinimonas alkaloidigena]|uniref:Uncharacterized protein n=1 Tax=Catalinimonas alkaloidigena TaxID=1075417 RepID=A0A1G9V778_9BACT|nr:hypothetical protein [Catalinimonas alkaloidigena]SDM68072.1 hypothetical protein SAMN05421823_11940 [Catalinimonas alkaloidigena]